MKQDGSKGRIGVRHTRLLGFFLLRLSRGTVAAYVLRARHWEKSGAVTISRCRDSSARANSYTVVSASPENGNRPDMVEEERTRR